MCRRRVRGGGAAPGGSVARKPTGRPPGRPPGDRYGTPQERVSRARTLVPSLHRFPHLVRAVERVMEAPNRTVFRSPYNTNPADVDLLHVYSPAEGGQILSFTWWAHVNRRRWSRRRRLAAVTLLSPLLLFSSSFFEEMTELPSATCQKWMVRPEGMQATRVLGSCDMRVIHLALEAATRGDTAFRLLAADIVRDKGVPEAMASRARTRFRGSSVRATCRSSTWPWKQRRAATRPSGCSLPTSSATRAFPRLWPPDSRASPRSSCWSRPVVFSSRRSVRTWTPCRCVRVKTRCSGRAWRASARWSWRRTSTARSGCVTCSRKCS